MQTPEFDADWTPERIQSHFDNEIAEDFRLDYKGLEALPLPSFSREMKDSKKAEMGKDATAFANSDGGVLIYGIKEKKLPDGRPVPSQIQAVSMVDVSRDQIAQIISSQSEPKIVGVRVLPIQAPKQFDPSMVCYVVVIPKGSTAHMAGDGRYYYRNETTTDRMRGWAVRDVMNRSNWPSVEVSLLLWEDWGEEGPCLKFNLTVHNAGDVICRDYSVHVVFPMKINGKTFDIPDGVFVSTERGSGLELRISNHQNGPLFPRMKTYHNLVLPQYDHFRFEDNSLPLSDQFSVTVYADNMPPRRSWKMWDEVQLK